MSNNTSSVLKKVSNSPLQTKELNNKVDEENKNPKETSPLLSNGGKDINKYE